MQNEAITKTDEPICSSPYSYHTFLFPFLWNVSGGQSQEEFESILSVGTRWLREDWSAFIDRNPYESGLEEQEWRLKFAEYQYFTPAALDIVYGVTGKDNVKLYRYVLKKDAASGVIDAQYVIEKGNDRFELALNAVRLKVYDTGIAVLIIETENHKYQSIDQVNAINEYGRRINMPFLPRLDAYVHSHALCADRISIVIEGKEVVTEAYLEYLEHMSKKETAKEQSVSWNYAMKPIQYLLDHDGMDNGGKRISTNKRKNCMQIEPCIDDRMFVCCLVRDDALSKRLSAYDEKSGEYRYLAECCHAPFENHSLADDLYQLLYVETDLTCQSVVRKKKLLERSVYDRWIDYGTVHGVTHHSLVCLTGEDPSLPAKVINPFLTQCVEMAILSLVQRAHQLLLFKKISEISESFRKEQFHEIENLQEFYVRCQDQILLSEVTAQEQGIEIYDMLQEELYIPKNKAVIDAQMNNLRDVSNISHERKIRETEEKSSNAFNLLAIAFSVLTVLEISFERLEDFLDGGTFNWRVSLSLVAVKCLVVGVVYLLCQRKAILSFFKSKRKNRKK